MVHAYAAIVEAASDIAADPATPLAFKRALGQAERAATPAAETLQISVTSYSRASCLGRIRRRVRDCGDPRRLAPGGFA
ncbi:hypothetical protein ATE48_02425 [Candidatus Viadribacter manganicus]|uniref:Uncharacterized protein n=1 Tax=Candidatus Viadribacter manganicus TaxID=1759059 RepID=A0A1B1AE77_9PROT|nr:hypothetical protein ATE48_02425 [Candidatus Viadribacter manganicus]